jgi:hypothetical protein
LPFNAISAGEKKGGKSHLHRARRGILAALAGFSHCGRFKNPIERDVENSSAQAASKYLFLVFFWFSTHLFLGFKFPFLSSTSGAKLQLLRLTAIKGKGGGGFSGCNLFFVSFCSFIPFEGAAFVYCVCAGVGSLGCLFSFYFTVNMTDRKGNWI